MVKASTVTRDHNLAHLLEIEPVALAEDLRWFLEGADAPQSLTDLEPWRNEVTKKYFGKSGEQEKPQTPGPAFSDAPHEDVDDSQLDMRLLLRLNGMVRSVDSARQRWQDDMMESFIGHEQEICEFASDMNYCDSTLKLIEEALLKHYKSLEAASTNIKKLHTDSSELSACLDNRQAFLNALQTFLDDIAIRPCLIKALCSEPVGEGYVKLLEQFQVKVHKMKTVYENMPYPALHPSKIQMKKLELVVIGRIYDFMRIEIAKLATPKTNIQMLQQAHFLRLRPLYAYIRDVNVNYAAEIKNQYAKTLRKIYYHLFSSYYMALDRFRMKNRYKEISMYTKRSASSSGGYFLLGDRDQVLRSFRDDPMVPTGISLDSLQVEDMMRSFLKLLVDTASSEYIFIGQFFEQGIPALFNYIFEETLGYLRARVEHLLKTSCDVVMLTTVMLLIAANRQVMVERRINVLDETLGKLQADVHTRAMHHLKNMAKHLMSYTIQASSATLDTWLPGVHTINLSNLVGAIFRLKAMQDELGVPHVAFDPLDHFLQICFSALTLKGRKLANPAKLNVFVIANCTAFLHPLEQFKDQVSDFEDALCTHIENYVNGYVKFHFESLLQLIGTHDESTSETAAAAKAAPGGSGLEADGGNVVQAEAPQVSSATVAKWRSVGEDFANNARTKFQAISTKVELHFSQEATARNLVMDVVVQTLEEMYCSFYSKLTELVRVEEHHGLEMLPSTADFRQWLMRASE
ncbi:vacuolar protein sorting-associated protein 52 A isoform X1 [Babesia caballi]|uniref:Vacuolar protein sorting-associated protein 52 A isoform X1 n=1 Tax=Babesia caballi TaxID=5871 RepID=A0AAV4LPC9_BABCB|nr:vacuolar protein sorting-associated protein 52 A isoform X1 [Babesia caballi]